MGASRKSAANYFSELSNKKTLSADHLVYPLFVNLDLSRPKPIASMPGVFQWPVRELEEEVSRQIDQGLKAVMLFGVVDPSVKDESGKTAWDSGGPVPTALRQLAKRFPELTLIADVCLCEYTAHGHCGVFEEKEKKFTRVQEATLQALSQSALCYAEAGAQVVAPSAAADLMVGTIRTALNQNHYQDRGIMSYSVKYASAFYGPFREAANNRPKEGTDRRGYQLNPRLRTEALLDAAADVQEGADALMVKPGLPYLDVLSDLVGSTRLPVGVYQVSGEYSMLKAAASGGAMNEEAIVSETFTAFWRAGARYIISYFTPMALSAIKSGRW